MSNIDDALAFLKQAEQALLKEQQVEAPPPIIPTTVTATGLQQPAAFYDYIRGDAGELFPTMSQLQVEGVEADLKVGAGILPLSWMSYCLATDYHETNQTMQPVKEAYWCSEEWRKANLKYYPWYGRGKVQLTWEQNYKHATERLKVLGFSVDLIAKPDDALDLKIAAVVLIRGMLEGWFSGKMLNDYLPVSPSKENYTNARQIVNGMDKADLIAGYAVVFEKALKNGGWL